MNSFYEYFAAQQKMAAYRQAKRMQRGVKLGENQAPSMATKFTTAPLQIGTGDFSVEFYGNSYGSDANLGYPFISYADGIALNRKFSALARPGTNGVALLPFGESTFRPSYVVEDADALFHMVVTRSGTDVALYIDGSKVNDFATDSIVDFGTMDFLIANSQNVGFVRVWNYALSADDVTAHYNNGDPMGYVVPKAMRDLSPIQITGVNTYTWTGPEDVTEFRVTSSPRLQYLHKYRVNISVSDYQSGTPYLYADSVVNIPASNGTYDVELEVSDAQYIYVTMYGGSPGSDRRLTLTVNSITPVGLLAEYLPQNLMYGRDDKTIATSWLDSAKQLPLSDEYMEPLFQSIGGYDMAANGVPEILYHE